MSDLKYPFFVFSMPLDNTPQLNQGRLCLRDWERGDLGRWVATSGLGQFQKIGGWSKQGGGVCPAAYPGVKIKSGRVPVDLADGFN